MIQKNWTLLAQNYQTWQVGGLKIVENHQTAYVDVSLTYPEWGIPGSSNWGMYRGCKQHRGVGKGCMDCNNQLAELGSIVGIVGIVGGSPWHIGKRRGDMLHNSLKRGRWPLPLLQPQLWPQPRGQLWHRPLPKRQEKPVKNKQFLDQSIANSSLFPTSIYLQWNFQL